MSRAVLFWVVCRSHKLVYRWFPAEVFLKIWCVLLQIAEHPPRPSLPSYNFFLCFLFLKRGPVFCTRFAFLETVRNSSCFSSFLPVLLAAQGMVKSPRGPLCLEKQTWAVLRARAGCGEAWTWVERRGRGLRCELSTTVSLPPHSQCSQQSVAGREEKGRPGEVEQWEGVKVEGAVEAEERIELLAPRGGTQGTLGNHPNCFSLAVFWCVLWASWAAGVLQ